MKQSWKKIVGLLAAIAALSCMVISMFHEGNNVFLSIGLACNCIALALFISINKKEKTK